MTAAIKAGKEFESFGEHCEDGPGSIFDFKISAGSTTRGTQSDTTIKCEKEEDFSMTIKRYVSSAVVYILCVIVSLRLLQYIIAD